MMSLRTKEDFSGGNVVLKKTIMLGAALVLTAPVLAQETDFSAAEIKTQQVGNGLFMLMLVGAGAGNIALSTGADGSVLVDTQFAPLNEKLVAAVRAAGGGDVK